MITKQVHLVKRTFYLSLLTGFIILAQFGLTTDSYAGSTSQATPDSATRARIVKDFGKLPVLFIENRGQMDPRVAYYIKGHDKALYFTSKGLTFALTGSDKGSSSTDTLPIRKVSYRPGANERGPGPSQRRWVVKLDFVGAEPSVKLIGEALTPTRISYFKGRPKDWKTGLNTYGRLVYADLWPGIDLVYTGTVNRMKYTFLVKPGADPGNIRLAYRGADVSLSDAGSLKVTTPVGGFYDDAPYAYQGEGDKRTQVGCSYLLDTHSAAGGAGYGFKTGPYDKSRPLILDPAILVYCGYIGGSNLDLGYGIAVDTGGKAYVTGYTGSDEATFSVISGPDLTFNGNTDVFVARLKADGSGLDYCGYIGGSNSDYGYGIAVDTGGKAYVTGYTYSDEASFPVKNGPDLTFNGNNDAFVARIRADGSGLDYCGYIGGSDSDYGYGIAVDTGGKAYVTGYTCSDEASFPVKNGPDLTFNEHQFSQNVKST